MTRLRRTAYPLLLAVLAALLLAVAPASPVAARPGTAGPIPNGCSSINLNNTEAVRTAAGSADHVFVGRVVGLREVPADGSGDQTGQPQDGDTSGSFPSRPSRPQRDTLWQHEVAVKSSLKGSIDAGAVVDIALVDSPSKPQRLAPGETYVFFAQGSMSPLQADACEGYVVAGAFDIEALREVVAPASPDLGSLTPPASDAGDRPELGRLVAPGAALTLVGVLGLLLISRVSRRRP